MKHLLQSLAIVCLALTSTGAGADDPAATLAGLPRSELQIVTDSGTHRFQVWIAADYQSRYRGLMSVRELPADDGMLFLFPRPQYASFWMKDTTLSLDIIYIAADGAVVNIAHRTTPLSERQYLSAGPVLGVLEVLGGTAARIGLAAGHRIIHPAFAAQKYP